MQKPTKCWTIPLVLLLVLGLLVTTMPMQIQAQDSSFPSDGSGEPGAHLLAQDAPPIPPFTPGVILVGVRGDVVAAASTWGGIEVNAVEPLDLRTSAVSAAATEGTAAGADAETLTGYKLTVPTGTEWNAIETLLARADVAFAEPDWLAQIAQIEPVEATVETPFAISDTLYREQWYLQRIRLSRAWVLALSEGGLEPIEVAVIDTGVDFGHPDLANRLLAGRNYISSTQTPMDDNGHGTHISGLIAAAANGAGMVGTGRQVKILPLKALNGNGMGGVSTIGQAIRDAADEGAHIINLSLELAIDTYAMRTAVEYAASQGTLVIAASGNQGRSSVSYPAAYPSVLAVGATTYDDVRAYYSNRGPELDIVAPGGSSSHSILSTWTEDAGAVCPSSKRQVNGGLYCQADGTSMATGIVSGAAALVWSLRPELGADEVREILLETAAPISGSATDVGRGRLDAARAVRRTLGPQLLLGQRLVTAAAVENGTPVSRTLFLGNSSLAPLTVEVTPTHQVAWVNVVGPPTGEARYGEPLAVQLLFTPTAAGVGSYASDLRVTATNEEGGQSIYTVGTRLDVAPAAVLHPTKVFMPWAGQRVHFPIWAEPAQSGRTNYAISGDSSIVVDLPFTMTVGERTFSDVRIFVDGFVVAPASAFAPNLPNHCLDNQTWPSFAVYGWWSDLSPGAGSTLSTFQPDADHFVVEYNNFAGAGSSDPDNRVTFQIVLQREGQIELNYAQVPEDAPANLTVGASAVDGRFYNQITCFMEGTMRIGEMPQAHQSFFLQAEDLY
ncbi:MAG: S8 family serine peptidase [Caldilineaceae bacterium]|nr:S8 family serine peptidase [Caldilineaceae bacterium]